MKGGLGHRTFEIPPKCQFLASLTPFANAGLNCADSSPQLAHTSVLFYKVFHDTFSRLAQSAEQGLWSHQVLNLNPGFATGLKFNPRQGTNT